jgi:hypothetical protein
MPKVMHNGETDVTGLHRGVFVYCKISIDYQAIDDSNYKKAIEQWITVETIYWLCISIGSLPVSHIHTLLVLVVGITNGCDTELN